MHNFDLRIDSYDPVSRRITLSVTASLAGEIGPLTVTAPAISLADALAVGSFRELAALGQRFSEALLPPPLWSLWREGLGRAGKEGQRLRIRSAGVGDAALPWELLYDSQRRIFLAQDLATPVVRYLEGSIPAAGQPPPRPLTLLLACASPRELAALEVEAELSLIEQTLAPGVAQGHLRLYRADHLQVRQLHPLLRKEQPHVLHFAGHGVYDQVAQQGSLALETDIGRTDLLEAESLTVLLRAALLTLVTLSACESGVTGDPWSGVAHSLVQAGIPAVVAMGAQLSDAAAIAWAEHFYAAVAQGQPVDRAMSGARQAMLGVRGPGVRPAEWLVPVLFLRAADGRLWQEPESETEAKQQPSTGGISIGTINAANVLVGDHAEQTNYLTNPTFNFGEMVAPTQPSSSETAYPDPAQRGQGHPAPPQPGPPTEIVNRYALLVGVRDYVDPAHRSLPHTVTDVTALAALLGAAGYTVRALHSDQADLSLRPTRNNIYGELAALIGNSAPGDLILVHFAGHGDVRGNVAYLLCEDARRADYARTAVNLDDLKQTLAGAGAQAKVLLLDACHSGIGRAGGGMDPTFEHRVALKATGMAILSACRRGEVAFDHTDSPHGAFTHYLLEALQGANLDKDQRYITFSQVNNYVTGRVKNWAISKGYQQWPNANTTLVGDPALIDRSQSPQSWLRRRWPIGRGRE